MARRGIKKEYRKKVGKLIRKKGKDGKLTNREVRRIAGTSGGELPNRRIMNMIRKKAEKRNFTYNQKGLLKRIRRNNNVNDYPINPNYAFPEEGGIPAPGERSANIPKTIAAPKKPTIEEELAGVQEQYEDDLEMAEDPRNRNYVLGIRTKRGKRNVGGARGTFGRKGKRIQGIQSTSLNL